MGTVDIRIGHDNDFMITKMFRIKIILTYSRTKCGYNLLDLLAGKHLVIPGLLNVHDLAAQWQDSLKNPVPALFCTAAGRITLNQKQLPNGRILRLALGQLAGHHQIKTIPLFSGKLFGPAGSLPGPGRIYDLGENLSGLHGVLFKVQAKFFITDRLNNGPDLAVTQLGLGLAFELGVGHPHRNHTGNTLTDIITTHFFLHVLGNDIVGCVAVYTPGKGAAKPDNVGAAFPGMYIIYKRIEPFCITGIVLKADLDLHIILFTFEKNRLGVNRSPVAVQIFNKLFDPSLEVKFILCAISLIMEYDLDTFIEKGQLSKPGLNNIVFKFQSFRKNR